MKLRWVRVPNASDSNVPTARCGIHDYKLQVLVEVFGYETGATYEWRDIPVIHGESPRKGD